MSEMEITYVQDGSRTTRSNLTLVEQTKRRLYLDNEDDDSTESERIEDAKISEVRGCQKIGFINFDPKEVEKIENSRIPEPVSECVFLQGVLHAEQQGDQVYVEFVDGESKTFSGNLDRAYTY